MTGSALWYLSRATGAVSLVLLTLVSVMGIVVAVKARVPGTPRFVLRGLHRNASLLALAFLVVHIGTAVLDSYVPIDLKDVVIPFTSSYQPLWIGLGACAIDLLAAVLLTTLLRYRLGVGRWKAVHYLAYAMFPIAVLHGLRSGTDLRTGSLLATTLVCVAAVTAAVVWRLSVATAQTPRAARVAEVMTQAESEQRPTHHFFEPTGRGTGRW